ncbi:carboxymuconolactone decarboxylase family protein [Tenacibaculum sp. M341]|uniref:carboxymuconolactone decarboxylase family protein n=1 Tax=Tenacibaculum sp. M341 TaxID=2530339 RepID=UPI00104FC339|nr:carboxymuconolactone decarboxylase family protein [Tenacibaculum sp. M341]TCI91447.1 carboxymuconolactone decarboxylase family protein [Tenacibaculum sp. M341]
MSNFKIHTIETAPEASKPLLENSVKAFGMVPNLHAVMAESPATLEAYQNLHHLFSEKTAFNAEELTVIWQTINVENECHYCVPAHTAVANMMKVDPAISEALRNETKLANEKLQVLRETTLKIVQERGFISEDDVATFKNAGYDNQHLLEILLGYSQKILSNYTNHLGKTPVDAPFAKFAWSKTTV